MQTYGLDFTRARINNANLFVLAGRGHEAAVEIERDAVDCVGVALDTLYCLSSADIPNDQLQPPDKSREHASKEEITHTNNDAEAGGKQWDSRKKQWQKGSLPDNQSLLMQGCSRQWDATG